MLHVYAKSAVAQIPIYNVSFKLVQHLLEKNMLYYCKLCKIYVNQGKPSFEDAHTVCVYIYTYLCVRVYVYLL